MKVGVLALQGDVREHALALDRAGATPVPVKTDDAVAAVDALVLPGGESTTIGKLLDRFRLLEPVRARVEEGMPVLGTCAGLILMAREVVGREDTPHRLGCLDVAVRRNAYGRQIASFETEVEVAGLDRPFRAVFIRAPEIERVGEGVEVLAEVSGSPVLVRSGPLLGAAFHPEMTTDTRVHELFVTMIRG
ncbi:MAG TPA: pyridoxal 5'-phosphate synthase glutaminase subunit PdxT [Actinomycetota bacterium]|nr:pyridoxal 5'-phosphate synthase glutaminase subunit PdxT [Actinomycetota bacterium]